MAAVIRLVLTGEPCSNPPSQQWVGIEPFKAVVLEEVLLEPLAPASSMVGSLDQED